MPPVVIFSQDDCLARGCAWGQALPSLHYRLAHWHKEWAAKRGITRGNCLCKYMVEFKYAKQGYFWYRWMSMAQQHLFGTVLENRSNTVRWPQDADFAVAGEVIRQQPKWLYESLVRMVTVEDACRGGTIMWAHSMERLWFEIFDAGVPKGIDLHGLEMMTAKQVTATGACFLGARRRRR